LETIPEVVHPIPNNVSEEIIPFVSSHPSLKKLVPLDVKRLVASSNAFKDIVFLDFVGV
jgi:hypothetical protein